MGEKKLIKKILITGISSFIGFHLAKYFSQDFNVSGTISKNINDYKDIQKLRLSALIDYIEFVEEFDLRNHDMINKTIQYIKPDYFIYHAGWAKDYGSFNYDIKMGFHVNIEPLATVYSALKESECKGVIVTGSSAEYSDGKQANKETDVAFPNMPYGLSKLTETLYVKQLADRCNLPTRVVRVYIPFGPFDSPHKLIPSVISSLKKNKKIEISPCEQKRDFIYIEDLIKAYEALLGDLNRRPIFDIYNICSGKATKLKELLLIIATELGSSHDLLNFGAKQMREGEPLISYGSNQKIIDILGFKLGGLKYNLKRYLNELRLQG